METETYKVAKEILDKYGSSEQQLKSLTPLAKPGSGDLRRRHTAMPASTTNPSSQAPKASTTAGPSNMKRPTVTASGVTPATAANPTGPRQTQSFRASLPPSSGGEMDRSTVMDRSLMSSRGDGSPSLP